MLTVLAVISGKSDRERIKGIRDLFPKAQNVKCVKKRVSFALEARLARRLRELCPTTVALAAS